MRVVIPGTPVAQGRPRITTVNGRPRAFDPDKSRSWKGAAQVHMLEARKGAPLLTGPLEVEILAVFACPASEHRKREPMPRRWKATKPDAENIAKAVMDAGSGVLYGDDAQVAHVRVTKLIGAQGESARVEVTVRQLEADAAKEWPWQG